MSAGAVGAAPVLCKEAGCDKPAQGRGMCGTHWKRWARRNPNTRIRNSTMKAVEDVLPGDHAQLVEATGMCDEAVKNNLDWLKAEGRAHIGYFDPPTGKGTRWKAVWVPGPGENAKLTKARKLAHARAGERAAYARRQAGKAGWLGAMGIKALGARQCQK